MAYDKRKIQLCAYLDLMEHLYGHRPIETQENGRRLLDGQPLVYSGESGITAKLSALRKAATTTVKPAELRYVGGGEWQGCTNPVGGMYYACDRDWEGRWLRLFGPYATAQEAEARAEIEQYGFKGGWVIVYSAAAHAAADRGERPSS